MIGPFFCRSLSWDRFVAHDDRAIVANVAAQISHCGESGSELAYTVLAGSNSVAVFV
jgi:hypothetical protein